MNPQAGNVFRGVAVCIPLAGRPVPVEWAFAFKALDPPINYNVFHMSTVGLKVDEARNKCAAFALQQKAKYLFFLGDDVVPPGHVLRRFIYLLENMDEIDVLSGVYFTKQDPSFPLVFQGNGHGSYWGWKLGELFQVTGCGMDCCLIRTTIFERLAEPWFVTIKADQYADAVACTECWTEDLYFCDRVEKELGAGHIWVDASIICDHWDVTTMKKYSMPWNCKPAMREFSYGTKKVLDLGSPRGEVSKFVDRDGIPVRVDPREDAEPDYRCDLRALPFADETWDVVRSVYALAHFERLETAAVLDEWLRVLKPGGQLRICVPDLGFAARQILNGGLKADGMTVLYGQSVPLANKTGFTEQSLRALLKGKNLRVDKLWVEEPYNLMAECTKRLPRGVKGDGEGRAVVELSKQERATAQKRMLKA